MFSSLASFLFGSNTNCETNRETTKTAAASGISEEQRDTRNTNLVDVENLIEVTSLTPSVTGAAGDRGQRAFKRGKNKRNNVRQQNKREAIKAPLPLKAKQLNIENFDQEEELDEDEWFIVEKEASPAHSDSEEGENVPVTTVIEANKPVNANVAAANNLGEQRRVQHINTNSLYSGPRPQKQRNFLQKSRNNCNNRLSVSTLSPSRTVNDGRIASGHGVAGDGGLTRSLYVVPTVLQPTDEKAVITINGIEALNKMEDSWFVTPPPCFTSIGPINMQASPYENLLIEHPSMSVYHSIKTAEKLTNESFIKLDVEVNDVAETEKSKRKAPKKALQPVQPRASAPGYRFDRATMAQLKQEAMARDVQKVKAKIENKDICRSAIKRTNKVNDVQYKNYTKRRSDRQHCRICSYANNNRKTNSC